MPLLGDKYPALGLPGQQVWSEIWDTIGPMLHSVLSTGQATWSEDLLLPLATSSTADLSPGWPVGHVLRTGQPVTLTDVTDRFGPLPSGDWPDPPTEAMVLPLQGDGGGAPVGVIVLAASAGPRPIPTCKRRCAGCLPRTTRGSADVAASVLVSAPARTRVAHDPGVPHILLADDNADMREYLQRLLLPRYQVTTVTDGLAALDAARSLRPDLVISDVMMPRLDGIGLVNTLRADPRTADLPVLLLSARAGQDAAIEGLDAGADDYLVKPFSAAELLARVRASVQLSRMRGQHARWRAALIESLHEAFFVCGSSGDVLEINSAFADMLGYDAGGLPYRAPHPWWPDAESDPDAFRMAEGAYLTIRDQHAGSFTVPFTHSDGHRLWVTGVFNEVVDQENGRVVVGTLRDVTAEHDARQQDSETALILQRAILGPVQLPAGFSARYEPATRPLEVGGDWHDIVGLPDGRIAIVVGDCVGHDLGAATVMGQLRSACRPLLLQDASPGRMLAAMDKFAASVPEAEFTTMFCAILDPASGQLTYSAAGHPPGIAAHPDGAIDLLDRARSYPLAASLHAERDEASYALPPRSTLLLYTDGLVERRGRSLTDGIVEAGAAVVSGGEDSLEDLANQLMTHLAPPGGYGDDVAIVLYRHPAPLDLSFPADTRQLRPVRAQLRGWLDSCGLSTRLVQDALVAAGEAVANAVEHGHRDHPGGQIQLRAAVTANRLCLTIASRPARPAPPSRWT